MATHSSVLAWRIPWTEEPDGLRSTGSQSRTWRRAWALTASVLAETRRSTSQVGTAAVVGLWSGSSGEEWVTGGRPNIITAASLGFLLFSLLSRVWLFATPRTVARRAPLSMGFSRQECWSGLPLPPPGDLPTQGLNLGLLHCRQILYCLSYQGIPTTQGQSVIKILWVFSLG